MGYRAVEMSRNWIVAQMGCRADGISRNWNVAQMRYRAKKCRANDVNPLSSALRWKFAPFTSPENTPLHSVNVKGVIIYLLSPQFNVEVDLGLGQSCQIVHLVGLLAKGGLQVEISTCPLLESRLAERGTIVSVAFLVEQTKLIEDTLLIGRLGRNRYYGSMYSERGWTVGDQWLIATTLFFFLFRYVLAALVWNLKNRLSRFTSLWVVDTINDDIMQCPCSKSENEKIPAANALDWTHVFEKLCLLDLSS